MASAPTKVATTQSANFDAGGTTRTVSLTYNAGDLIVISGVTEDNGSTLGTPSASGLVFDQKAVSNTASYCKVYLWAAVAPAAGSSVTATSSITSGSWGGLVATVWRNHNNLGAVMSPANANGSAPAADLTTTVAHSAIQAVIGDWSAVSGATGNWDSSDATPDSGDVYVRTAGKAAAYAGTYGDVSSPAAITVGVTTPTTQKWMMLAVEVLPLPDAATDAVYGRPHRSEGAAPVSSGSAWGTGTWIDLLPAGHPYPIAITGFSYNVPTPSSANDATDEHLFEIGTGAASSETAILQIPVSNRRDTGVGYVHPAQMFLPEPVQVAANTRVAIRVTDSVASALTYSGVKIYFRELSAVTDATIAGTPASATASAPAPALALAVAPPTGESTASSPAPLPVVAVTPVAALSTASAPAPVISITGGSTTVVSPVGDATASAPTSTPAVTLEASAAGGTASPPAPAVNVTDSDTAPAADATASSPAPVPAIAAPSTPASATAEGPAPTPSIAVTSALGAATAAGLAPSPDISVLPGAATAEAAAPAPTTSGSESSAPSLTPSAAGGTPAGLLAETHLPRRAQDSQVTPDAGWAVAHAPGPTVLIVEDEPIELIELILETV